ncbi:hypothetical protein ACFE04_002591 [Oxalis oulophora]
MAIVNQKWNSLNCSGEVEELGLGFVRYTRGLGRKRIVISNNDDSPTTPSLKRQCSERFDFLESDVDDADNKSALEALPQDILIRILCGVEHKDLKQLFHVSKTIREATLIAKQWHFAYSTPTKYCAFRDATDLSSNAEDSEAPNAPRQARVHMSRLTGKNLGSISVALFASPTKKGLFMDE